MRGHIPLPRQIRPPSLKLAGKSVGKWMSSSGRTAAKASCISHQRSLRRPVTMRAVSVVASMEAVILARGGLAAQRNLVHGRSRSLSELQFACTWAWHGAKVLANSSEHALSPLIPV